MSIQRNFINQNPNGKFGRWNINSIDPDDVKLFFQHSQPHKHFEVIVRDGDLVVHGDISCNGTIYDTSGNDLVARVNANTIAAALANSNANYAITQTGLNATNIATNIGFINQNIGAIAANTLDASNNATAITGNSNAIEDNTADILGNANAIATNLASINSLNTRHSGDRVKISNLGSFAQIQVATGSSNTNNMALFIKPDPQTGTQRLDAIFEDTEMTVDGRFYLKGDGHWGLLEIGSTTNYSQCFVEPRIPNQEVRWNVGKNNSSSGKVSADQYLNNSDDRVKNNEKLIENATQTIMKLTPQIYDKFGNMDLSGDYNIESGLVTQEVYYNAPELRHLVELGLDISGETIIPDEMDISNINIGDDPDYGNHGWSKTEKSALNYTGLIPYLVKSNQELNEKLLDLEARLMKLEE